MFELLSKAVVESKQKVNIPKLSKEEPEEKEESEKAKREEERGILPNVPGNRQKPLSRAQLEWLLSLSTRAKDGGGDEGHRPGVQQRPHPVQQLC